jgi:hypothetical protein
MRNHGKDQSGNTKEPRNGLIAGIGRRTARGPVIGAFTYLPLFHRISFAAHHQGDRRAMLLVAPGWVRTDMGGLAALLSVEESVERSRGKAACASSTATTESLRGDDNRALTF